MYALISVSDKTGVVELAKMLIEKGYTILSTGGTAKHLKENGVEVVEVSDLTGFAEMMGGRCKMLHPKIFGATLARHDSESHLADLKSINMDLIGVVVINFYPFESTINQFSCTPEMAIDNMDIGGPGETAAAAKNYEFVLTLCDPSQYKDVEANMDGEGKTSLEFRKFHMIRAMQNVARYRTLNASYFAEQFGV